MARLSTRSRVRSRGQPGAGQVGSYLTTLGITDGKSIVERGLQLRVNAQPVGPQPAIVLTPSFPAIPGQPVAITVLADAFSAVAVRTLTLDGVALALDANGRVLFTAPATGLYHLVATATDLDGFTSTTTSTLRVRDPLDQSAPQVRFDPGVGGSRVTNTIVIGGSIVDSNLESWTLEIARSGGHAFRAALRRASGPVTGTLATLDPSRFAPSFYELRLTATDIAGRSAQVSTDVELDPAALRAASSAPSPISPRPSAARRSPSPGALSLVQRVRHGQLRRGVGRLSGATCASTPTCLRPDRKPPVSSTRCASAHG